MITLTLIVLSVLVALTLVRRKLEGERAWRFMLMCLSGTYILACLVLMVVAAAEPQMMFTFGE